MRTIHIYCKDDFRTKYTYHNEHRVKENFLWDLTEIAIHGIDDIHEEFSYGRVSHKEETKNCTENDREYDETLKLVFHNILGLLKLIADGDMREEMEEDEEVIVYRP